MKSLKNTVVTYLNRFFDKRANIMWYDYPLGNKPKAEHSVYEPTG